MDRLREHREAKNLSREALARAAHVSMKTIEAHEYGRTSDVSVSVAYRLSEAMGIAIDDLFSEKFKAETLKEGAA